MLEGSTLHSEEGAIKLEGQPTRPVIFRGVHVALDLGGGLEAKHAVFEDCTFSKTGGWFAYYSSYWTFDDCLLVQSNFSGLTGVDYGIQIRGCALLECKFPSRYLCGEPPGDSAAAYRDGWNAVEENGFQRCEMPPSFVWTTKRCSFTQCKVTGSEVYRSTTPLQVLMAVPPGSQDFLRDLQVNTLRDHAGAVKYLNASAKGPVKRRKMSAWKFAKATR